MTIKIKRFFNETSAYGLAYGLKNKGYYSINSEEDADYYGNWFSIKELKILSYAEGDVTLTTVTNENELKNQLIKMINWMKTREMFIGIPVEKEERKNELIYLGLENFIY